MKDGFFDRPTCTGMSGENRSFYIFIGQYLENGNGRRYVES